MKADEIVAEKMYELLEQSYGFIKGQKVKASVAKDGEVIRGVSPNLVMMKTTNGGALFVDAAILKAA